MGVKADIRNGKTRSEGPNFPKGHDWKLAAKADSLYAFRISFLANTCPR